MVLNLLDIIVEPRERYQGNSHRNNPEQEIAKEIKQTKAQEKAEKKAQKKAKKAQKKLEKAQKKAEKAKQKAAHKNQQSTKDLSSMPTGTVTTVDAPSTPIAEASHAAMPTGIVLAVCASLLVCVGSAWFYRRLHFNTPQ